MTSTPPFTDAPAPSPAGSPRRRWPGSATTPDALTRPADYALINGVYLAGLTGVAALWRAAADAGRRRCP